MEDIRKSLERIAWAAAGSTVEREVSLLLDNLLTAAVSGDYSSVATDLADAFWEAADDVGSTAAVPHFQDLFAALTEKCPALKEPLKKALEEHNPFKDLLPEDAPLATPECAPGA